MEGALVSLGWVRVVPRLYVGDEGTALPYVDVGHQVHLRFPFLSLYLTECV
jgi:hypothetical protein